MGYKNKKCIFNNCDSIFIPTSGKQKFCPKCSKVNKKILHNLRNKKYKNKNKEKIKISNKIYKQNNKFKIKIYNNLYQLNNKDLIGLKARLRYSNNKIKIIKRNNLCVKNRKQNDPIFHLQRNISVSINQMLKHQKSSKNKKSCLKYLPFTKEELRAHIEQEFKKPGNEWMTWDNKGKYIKDEWDDNDSLTWKWQLDHKIPHSTFKYDSMDSEEFKQCWSLSNLQPLSAKQNQHDGSTKIRHINIKGDK